MPPRRAIGAAAVSVDGKSRTAADAAAAGHVLLEGNELAAAEDSFRQSLRADPLNASALNGLAIVAYHCQQYEAGEAFARQAIRHERGSAANHNTLGRILKAAGRLKEAESAYRRALSLAPTAARIHVSLGVTLRAQGRLHEAVKQYVGAIHIDPNLVEAYLNLVNVFREIADVDYAISQFERLIRAYPRSAAAHFHYATCLHEWAAIGGDDDAKLRELADNHYADAARLDPATYALPEPLQKRAGGVGLYDAALLASAKAVERDPLRPELHHNLGVAYARVGSFEQAMDAFQRAIELKADFGEAYYSLGTALLERWRGQGAVDALTKCVELMPDNADAIAVLSAALHQVGKNREAAAMAERALALDADSIAAKINLATAQAQLRHVDVSLRILEDVMAGVPERGLPPGVLHNYLFFLNYSETHDAAAVGAAHRRLSRAMEDDRGGPRARADAASVDRSQLRIGYVSGDFNNHSITYFLEPLLERRDRARFAAVLYHAGAISDPETVRLAGMAEDLVPVSDLNNPALAARIRRDRIDVLVDLSGLTANNRLAALLERPAPVQATYLGYPTSTGLKAIDYRISDWNVDPHGWEAHNSERLLRFPVTYFCYRPRNDAPVAPLPALQSGFLTFGSFNNVSKISATTVALWSRVLHAVPGSRMLVKNRALAEQALREELWADFAREGIAAERVEFSGWAADGATHHATYNRVDIALDTWPYNGATTTSEALWMGVPVVSLEGNTHASRMGRSILAGAGFPALCASSPDGFVERAAALAADLSSLADLRASLRDRLVRSELMAEERQTRCFEDLLRHAWMSTAGG